MLDGVVADEIEVDIRRYVDCVFLEPERTVIDDIQVTRETVTLRVHRNKRQVDTRVAVHHDGVHDIVLVESHRQCGTQRRDETVEKQIHAVLIDIDILENSIHILLERLRCNDILHAENTLLLQYFLLAVGLLLVVFFAYVLTDTDRHIRIDTRGIKVFLYEREVLPEALVKIHLQVIQREGHAAVGLRSVLVRSRHVERILVRNHILDQLYRRIAFTLVLALAVFRGHNDILQSIYVRRQLHLHVLAVLTLTKS